MSEELTYTDRQLMTPTTDVALPCGVTLAVHRLRRGDHYRCLEQYTRYLEMIAYSLKRDPTVQEVREHMPQVLLVSYAGMDYDELPNGELVPVRPGASACLDFLACFTTLPEIDQPTDEHLSAEFGVDVEGIAYLRESGWIPPLVTILDKFSEEDWRQLWLAIWEMCQYPFAFRLQQARDNPQEIPAAIELARMTMEMTESSSSSSDAPASTRPTPPSKSSTRSRSRGRKHD